MVVGGSGGGSHFKLLISMMLLMIILTTLSIVSGNSFIGVGSSQVFSATVNGTATEYIVQADGFSIDAYTGAIIWLVVIVAIGVGAGATLLASGLKETSINLLYKAIFYGAVWAMLSIFPIPMMWDILFFGPLLYIVLTIVYVIAVIMVI